MLLEAASDYDLGPPRPGLPLMLGPGSVCSRRAELGLWPWSSSVSDILPFFARWPFLFCSAVVQI